MQRSPYKRYEYENAKTMAADVVARISPRRSKRKVVDQRSGAQDDRHHVCEKCNKVFVKKKYLNQHMNVHTTQHQCVVCEKTYCSSSNLKRHVKTHRK